ncbi:MAG TPA: phosphonate ABC transporter, permease protein PhnE [Candidatus Thalassarchaeaceae archaeon]|nr:MAG TPA: phosphonate ABC transporter, permease protein PhnE [Candidatus Poseidoniales archaeon]HII49675.1 phosphonate ABC transporter, permease protein PhnE [Candidatus Thalassarchaeaceae archaeon]|tara:strand:- start:2717 stop:3652 length:936 start_codon:yes stop_codon:yes gene_type:complete
MSDSGSKVDFTALVSRFWYSSRWFLLFIGLLVVAFRVTNSMDPNWGRLANTNNNLVIFFQESLWPPDWSVIEAQAYPPCLASPGLSFTCSTAWLGMIETLKIAFVATILGMTISFPLSLLASRNLSPNWVSYPARFLLAGSRSLPSIIWALFFVIVIGFGPLSGIFAMTVYTVGYLGKLQYETIEGIDRGPLEASKAMGHGWFERSFGVILPESANGLISQVIFMFEYNFRHGTVIGIVGAGGIGYYINLYLKFLQYDKVIAYLIIIFIVVLILDVVSIYARSLFTEDGDVRRTSWWSILLPSSMLRDKED